MTDQLICYIQSEYDRSVEIVSLWIDIFLEMSFCLAIIIV